MTVRLLDSHYHFDFIEDRLLRKDLLIDLSRAGIGLVAQTITPSSFISLIRDLEGLDLEKDQRPLPSLGFHPWWLESEDQLNQELLYFLQGLSRTSFIGEIGLDYSPKVLERSGRDLQETALNEMIEAIRRKLKNSASPQPFILSLHAVRSVPVLLAIFSQFQEVGKMIIPVVHRFSGTGQELTDLIKMGFCFSIHPKMLKSKRGRAYVRQIPGDRLLLETDLPERPGPLRKVSRESTEDDQAKKNGTSRIFADPAREVIESLTACLDLISQLRGEDMGSVIAENQGRLYGWA